MRHSVLKPTRWSGGSRHFWPVVAADGQGVCNNFALPIEGRAVSVIDCDYLPQPEPITFPPELALLIVRKAAAMAEAFESQALDQLTRDARRAD